MVGRITQRCRGDAAAAGRGEPAGIPSAKSLVALPALLAADGRKTAGWDPVTLCAATGRNESVQKLRAIAQQTGTLETSPQQKGDHEQVTLPPTTSRRHDNGETTTVVEPAPTTEIIKIESTDPNVVQKPTPQPQ